MNYIVKTMSKSIIKITEEDYNNIKGVSSGMVYTRGGGSFNLSSVDSIIPESDYLLEKADRNKGTLHDGQKVIKKFGAWYVDDGSFSVVVDPNYFPEVSQDCVPTREEFSQKYLQLPQSDRLSLILEGSELKRDTKRLREGGGLKRLSTLKHD